MTTAPWHPSAIGRLATSQRHIFRLTAHTRTGDVPLEVVTGTVTEDEDSAPRWTSTISCRVPATQDVVDALDPRSNVRVTIEAGYDLPVVGPNVYTLCELDLLDCVIRRPQNDMVLTLGGRESRLTDTVAVSPGPVWTASSDAATALRWLIATFDPTSLVDGPDALGPFVTGQDATRLQPGDNPWSMVATIADRVGVEVWADGDGLWHIDPAPTLAGITSAWLATGANGNLTSTQSKRSRRGFYNAVVVVHEYVTDSGPQRSIGYAAVTSGPYSVNAIGRWAIKVTIPFRGTVADAEAAASTMVARGVSRGRALGLEAANAAYWVRAGLSTIQAQLPTGKAERHLVARQDFDLPSGGWHVTTRLPENATITEGE